MPSPTLTKCTMNGVFVENLPIPVEFLHRDELILRYQISDVQLPVIFSAHPIIGRCGLAQRKSTPPHRWQRLNKW
ncbi:MAG: hypothetical protein R3C26_04960 [Calditrichia bacterium]